MKPPANTARGCLYLEVQPDDPELTKDPAELAQSRKRMRFYEQYGVRPIINTAYHTPVGDPPTTAYLLFDPLNIHERPDDPSQN